MHSYITLPRNRFFEIMSRLMSENRSDCKVAMLSELDVSSCVRLRTRYGQRSGAKPSWTALVMRAVALALREHPHANRIIVEKPFWTRIVQLNNIHVSVAAERNDPSFGMVAYAATLRDTDTKDLSALTSELSDLAKAPADRCPRWRALKWIVNHVPCRLASGLLSIPRRSAKLWVEHRGGAVLISSPAKYGVDAVVGTWGWPLGFSFGLIKERPFVVAGAVVARPTMTLTMSFDRRLLSGAPAARFFRCICDFLEHAELHLAGAPETGPDERVQPRACATEPRMLCGPVGI